MELLIKAGAMDCFGLRRSQMLAMADEAIAMAQQNVQDKAAGQMSLFDMLAPEDKNAIELSVPDIPEWPLMEKLDYEKELLGFYVSGHPISSYQELVDRYQSHDLSKLASLNDRTTVRVGAYVSAVSIKMTKKDNRPWAILNLETQEARIECLFFPDAYEEALAHDRNIFQKDSVVFIDGEVSKKDEDEGVKINGRLIYAANDMPRLFTKELQVRLYEDKLEDGTLEKLRNLCEENSGNSAMLYFFLHCKDGNIAILRSQDAGIRYSGEFRQKLCDLVGSENVFATIERKAKPPLRRQFNKFANNPQSSSLR